MNPIINKKTCRHWLKEKLSTVALKTSFLAKQMMWICFTKSFVIGPHFFSNNVNADSNCGMIESFVFPKLKEKGQLSRTTFQQGEASPHTAPKTQTCSVTLSYWHHFQRKRILLASILPRFVTSGLCVLGVPQVKYLRQEFFEPGIIAARFAVHNGRNST